MLEYEGGRLLWGAQKGAASTPKTAGDSNGEMHMERGDNKGVRKDGDKKMDDGADYDPDVAHWRKPPIPSGTPTSASFRARAGMTVL